MLACTLIGRKIEVYIGSFFLYYYYYLARIERILVIVLHSCCHLFLVRSFVHSFVCLLLLQQQFS